MLDTGKPEAQQSSATASDITIGQLIAALAIYPQAPLLFRYGDRTIRQGYHVTEVKAAEFRALDCGGNPEAWSEMFIELWDVNEARETMASGKFGAIIAKVTDHVGLDHAARLTFEVSDGVGAKQLFQASVPHVDGEIIVVDLSPRPASCKPRDRWLAQTGGVRCCAGQESA